MCEAAIHEISSLLPIAVSDDVLRYEAINTLKNMLDSEQSERVRLQTKLLDKKQLYKQNLYNLKEQNAKLVSDKESGEHKVGVLEKQSIDDTNEIRRLHLHLTQISHSHSELQKSLAVSDAVRKEMQLDLSSHEAKIAQLEAEIKRRMDDVSHTSNHSSSVHQKLQRQIDHLASKNREQLNEIDSKSDMLSRCHDTISRLEEQLQKFHNDNLSSMRKKDEIVEECNQNAKNLHLEHQCKMQRMKNELLKRDTEKEQLEEYIREMKNTLNQLRSSRKDPTHEDCLLEALAPLKEEIRDLKHQKLNAESELHIKQSELNQQAAILADLQCQLSELVDEVHRLKNIAPDSPLKYSKATEVEIPTPYRICHQTSETQTDDGTTHWRSHSAPIRGLDCLHPGSHPPVCEALPDVSPTRQGWMKYVSHDGQLDRRVSGPEEDDSKTRARVQSSFLWAKLNRLQTEYDKLYTDEKIWESEKSLRCFAIRAKSDDKQYLTSMVQELRHHFAQFVYSSWVSMGGISGTDPLDQQRVAIPLSEAVFAAWKNVQIKIQTVLEQTRRQQGRMLHASLFMYQQLRVLVGEISLLRESDVEEILRDKNVDQKGDVWRASVRDTPFYLEEMRLKWMGCGDTAKLRKKRIGLPNVLQEREKWPSSMVEQWVTKALDILEMKMPYNELEVLPYLGELLGAYYICNIGLDSSDGALTLHNAIEILLCDALTLYMSRWRDDCSFDI
eukprot:Platyproteum_vivax@DN2522_c0_g1_i1.p1